MARNSSIFRRIVQLVLDQDSVRRTKAALQNALNSGTDAKGVQKNFRAIDAATARLRGTIVGLGATFLGVFSARKLIEYADTWKLIEGRLKIVTDGADQLRRVQDELLGVANETRTSYEATAKLFTRIALNADELGRSERELLDLTEAVNKAIQVGGGAASEASAGVVQLSQALASGVLRGDEFRSVMENMPGLAKAMADGLNVPVGKLREMAFAGELTADVVIDAILRMKGSIDEDFAAIPVTIGGAFTVLGNEIMEFVGNADEGSKASSAFADTILAMAQTIDMATAALKRYNEARKEGARNADPMRAGLGASLDLTPEEIERFRQQGERQRSADDIRQQRGLEMLRAPFAAPDLMAPIFDDLITQLESERTELIVKTKAAGAATAKEINELNDLYRRGNELLRTGNLALQDRARLVAALASLGFEEAKAKAQEDFVKKQQEEIDLLIAAHELGVATFEERRKLAILHDAIVATLKDENLALERRVQLTKTLREIEKAVPSLDPESLRRPVPQPGVGDLLADRRDREGNLIVRAPTVDIVQNQELAEIYADQWREAHAAIEGSAINAAFGVMGAWQDAIEAIAIEHEGLAEGLEALFRGSAAAILGGLAEVASAKVAENIAHAFEELAKAAGASAVGNFPGAAAHMTAAKTHGVAALKWGLVGGAAAAGQAAIAGGGRGGQSGGIPSGARDPAGRLADRVKAETHTIVYVTMDPLDPRNGSFQTLVGEANVFFNQRRGRRITGTRR